MNTNVQINIVFADDHADNMIDEIEVLLESYDFLKFTSESYVDEDGHRQYNVKFLPQTAI